MVVRYVDSNEESVKKLKVQVPVVPVPGNLVSETVVPILYALQTDASNGEVSNLGRCQPSARSTRGPLACLSTHLWSLSRSRCQTQTSPIAVAHRSSLLSAAPSPGRFSSVVGQSTSNWSTAQ